MKIFISWSGRRSKQVADALASWLNEVFEAALLEIFVSTQGIRAGAKWSEIINQALRDSTFGVLCLTPENLNAPWVLFEGGALSKTVGEGAVCPYLYDLECMDLKKPLEQFNGVKADKEGTRSLVFSINERLDERRIFDKLLTVNFESLWKKLEDKFKEIPSIDSDISLSLSQLQQELPRLIGIAKERNPFATNNYFAQVAFDSIQQFKTSLENSSPYFDVPITLYPLHLISLLEKFRPVVKAIAIVDAIEKFWPQKEGEEILKATTVDSTRIFVFREREHLKANLAVLQRHAQHYNVYALSFNRLASEYPDYAQDFSIIGGTSMPLLAYYTESSSHGRGSLPLKMIRFSASPDELSRHEEVMNGLLTMSTPVANSIDVTNETQSDDLLDKVFTPEFKEFRKKHVEMSAYIEVDQYDAHEEEHAYFQAMMDEMLNLLKQHREEPRSVARILELGAGTGLFTKRLAEIENLDITALEIDWACFHLLKKNMAACESIMKSKNTKLHAENKDSRKFDPPGKFQFIVSSFSDHHIYFFDKEKYLRNVKKNLENNGFFIVGDEFLPEHDEKDAESRREALESYHQHIISIAQRENHPILAQLEERALESGLRGWGDFKVSCAHYEKLLSQIGFELIYKHKVGPQEIENIGGVYVYAFKLQ